MNDLCDGVTLPGALELLKSFENAYLAQLGLHKTNRSFKY
jgi:hypothetical protein